MNKTKQKKMINQQINRKRRRFIGALGAAGASFGTPALLAGCFGGGGDDAGAGDSPGAEQRTLFFNLGHLGSTPTTHWLYAAGHKHALERVADRPEVLRQARLENAFLREVPDDRITHHVEGVVFSTRSVTLAYMTCNESPETGRWEMTSMHFNIPSSTAAHAYQQLSVGAAGGVLPLSNKRRAYGVRAAASARDLLDEHALVDCFSHADALVGVHPDILSIEPNSAAVIHAKHVSVNEMTQFLGELLQKLGPAVPVGSTSISGAAPWANLVPLLNDSTHPPSPYRKSDGHLYQYQPDWTDVVEQTTVQALRAVHPLVRNDTTLGVDVTGYTQARPLPFEQAQGKVWARHDGSASVDHSAAAAQAVDVPCVWRSQTAETGLVVYPPSAMSRLGDGRIEVTIDGVANWFLRWLGMWVQFVDPNGNVLLSSSLPDDTLAGSLVTRGLGLDKADALFVGVLAPPTTICGIPVYPGLFSPVVKIPTGAATMRVFYGGLGQSGSLPGDPAGIIGPGLGMTIAVNYALVGLFMAAGVSTLDKLTKKIVAIGGGLIAARFQIVIGGVLNGNLNLWAAARSILKVLFQAAFAAPALVELLTWVAKELAEAEFIDSIPIAGQIARAVAATIGAVQLAETSLEVALSPAVYQFELALVHDLSVDVLPDQNNSGFPVAPSGYALYYKVIYLFDQGRAHVQDAVEVPIGAKRLPIKLTAIPRGGLVNIKIGLYMRAATAPAGQNDWCAGYGSTGLVSNLVDRADSITITQTKVPIQATTVYRHTLKTRLDANAHHAWTVTSTAPPYVPTNNGQTPALGDFRSITVRQPRSGQSPQQGYVGYAWRAFSTGVNDCRANSPGQLDLLANLNTDLSDDGVHAQDGYATVGCGLQAGASVAYGLLDSDDRNFYLDSDTRHVRQVQLAPAPKFASPGGDQSFGHLNHASTRLLLHPSGHIVSISTATHQMETLKLPLAPKSDAEALTQLRARTHSGRGTRPGLMTRPVTAAISPEGVIVVVEGSDEEHMRLQAFDLGGNPIPYFKRQALPYFFPLALQGRICLDLAIEFTGYIYLLSRDAQYDHRLDIYHPQQTGSAPICSTQGVNAARLAVDLWRSVYTLNYETLVLPNGSIPGLTEPSVSVWIPPPPT